MRRALDSLLRHVDDLVVRAANIDRILFESRVLSRLTSRQVTLFNIMLAT
ncbi:hypothetical protein GNG27_05920 [Leclercia sp. 119287]|nr:hypothetical protein [Leclercia sp. 119287]QGU14218.1 hypothetical protein GNG27_05920 [Leclercia sp. 119287]